MVYIFTALYCEAYIFIRHFHLIKKQENTWFQQFYHETAGIVLTITGVGEIAAAAAVSSVCSLYRPTHNDFLLNIGICAHTAKDTGIFLCNKIVEKATGRTFYPDMLFRHHFTEETIVTGMQPYYSDGTRNGTNHSAGALYDMEAAAVYQTGSHFFSPHQMLFLKIVSDSGKTKDVSKEQTVILMEQYKNVIFDFIGHLSFIAQTIGCHESPFSQEDEMLIETFCKDLHCSKTMKNFMIQYIHYLALEGIDYSCMIRELYEKKLLPCKDKREGKQYFERFKERLF